MREGFSITARDRTVTTEFVSGLVRRRRIATKPVSEVSMQFMMSPEQMHLFQEWFDNQIKGGATPFTINLPAGSAMVAHRCQAIETWNDEVQAGLMHRVGIKALILSGSAMDSELAGLVYDANTGSYRDLLAAIEAAKGLSGKIKAAASLNVWSEA
ncbi:MAG: hypothetical protein AAF418_07630 [Pseudomonadota bacterium]